MDDSGRIDALEARLDSVESELRNLIDAIDVARAAGRETSPTPAAPAPLPAAPPRRRRRSWAGRDLEAWFGENALLVVGVLALVAAAGFTLKHAIEQGWISP